MTHLQLVRSENPDATVTRCRTYSLEFASCKVRYIIYQAIDRRTAIDLYPVYVVLNSKQPVWCDTLDTYLNAIDYVSNKLFFRL